jgi:hypothetical protein
VWPTRPFGPASDPSRFPFACSCVTPIKASAAQGPSKFYALWFRLLISNDALAQRSRPATRSVKLFDGSIRTPKRETRQAADSHHDYYRSCWITDALAVLAARYRADWRVDADRVAEFLELAAALLRESMRLQGM